MREEVATLAEALARRQAQRAAEMRGREQEEALRALEFEARQRMWAMEQAAARDAALGKLRAEVEAKEAVLDAKHQEVWHSAGWLSVHRGSHTAQPVPATQPLGRVPSSVDCDFLDVVLNPGTFRLSMHWVAF